MIYIYFYENQKQVRILPISGSICPNDFCAFLIKYLLGSKAPAKNIKKSKTAKALVKTTHNS